ncbi:tetratricopeptide repeat protein [Soonwooa sp.]|uniref:tetratricopeptide repeat protein n=1 Tax=Soonwooa sp. TaxID=1938592 RepID=UPI002628EDA2|nr:tetratricopeptide repeat protein [Soonwooa sp.]
MASKDDLRKVIGLVYLSDYFSVTKDEEKQVSTLKKAQDLASSTKSDLAKAYVDYGFARYYLSLNKGEQFVKAVNESISVFEKQKNENFILTLLYFLKFSYQVKTAADVADYKEDAFKALDYAKKSHNKLLINFTYNNVGFYYKNLSTATNQKKFLDSADVNYRRAFDVIKEIQPALAQKRSLIAYYINYSSLVPFIRSGNASKESLDLAFKALDLTSKDANYVDLTSLIYNNIGYNYENEGNVSLAESYYQKAYDLGRSNTEIMLSSKISTIDNLSRIYSNSGRFEKALVIEREAKDMIQQESKERFDNNTKSLQIFYETEKKNEQIHQLELINKAYTRQLWMLLAIVIIVIAAFVILFNNIKYKHKLARQQADLLGAEKNETELKLQLESEEKARLEAEQKLLEVEQERLQKQTLAKSIQLDQKNSIINELTEQIKTNTEQKQNIDKLLRDDKMMERDLTRVQDMHEEVHPQLFKKLNEVSKGKLTTQDLKYASYMYLNMDNQQIANLLKVEVKTVRMTKYRLKIKLGLDKDMDLQSFIQNLTV